MKALLVLFMLHVEPANGSMVTAVFEAGDITVTMPARLIPCARGKRCVQLPNGRRMQGKLDGEKFFVEEAP